MSEVTVATIEKRIADMEKQVARKARVQKLMRNRDFRELILEEFCVREAANYIHEAGNPALPQESRDDALQLALASGHLLRYLNVIEQMGNQAEADIATHEALLDDIRAEEDY